MIKQFLLTISFLLSLIFGNAAPLPPSGLSFVSPPPTVVIPKTFYLAPRVDGKGGIGAINDPLNVINAERLYNIWNQIFSSPENLQNTRIIFLPGTYYSSNEISLPLPAKNINISGYGALIIQTNASFSGQNTMLRTHWGGNDNITVEGLELDCGSGIRYTNSGKVCGLFLKGKNNIIRNVVVRNISTANFGINVEHETFGIIFQVTNGICCNNFVDGFISPTSIGGMTAISIQGEGNTVNGNVVNLNENPHNNIFSFAYTIYGSENTLTANSCRGVDAALSMDGAGGGDIFEEWHNNIIIGNQFIANELTFRIDNNTQSYKDWLIIGNNFKTKSMWLSLYTYGEIWRSNKITGFNFIGNKFSGTPRPSNNIALGNFINHTFIANNFSTNPTVFLGTNINTIYSSENTLNNVLYEPLIK